MEQSLWQEEKGQYRVEMKNLKLNITSLNKIQSFLLGAYVCVPLINQVTRSVFPNAFFMSMIYFVLIAAIAISMFLSLTVQNYRYVTYDTLTVVIFIVIYCVVACLSQKSSMSSFSAVSYVIVPLLAGAIMLIDYLALIKSILVIATFALIYINKFFVVDTNGYISMGLSYICLTPIIAASLYISFCYSKDNGRGRKVFLIFSIAQAIYLVKLFKYGSRGPILSIILCWLFISVIRYNDECKCITIKKTKIGFGLLALLIFVWQFYNILLFTNQLLIHYGIPSQIIEKTLRLMSQSSILNSRESIYSIALNEIWKRPILGHGLSSFEAYTGINYPHNFLIQLLFDGGFFLFSIIVGVLIKNTTIWLKKCNYNTFILYVLLFFISIPGALFSGDVWQNERFWLFIGLVISLPIKDRWCVDNKE